MKFKCPECSGNDVYVSIQVSHIPQLNGNKIKLEDEINSTKFDLHKLIIYCNSCVHNEHFNYYPNNLYLESDSHPTFNLGIETLNGLINRELEKLTNWGDNYVSKM